MGETLHRLVSKVCCLAVRSALPDVFLPFGHVGVGVSGGLEAAIHSLRTILSTLGSKLDLWRIYQMPLMSIVVLPSYLDVNLFFLSFLLGFNGVTVVQGSCILDPTIFYPILESSRVTLWGPFCSHWSSLTICPLAPPLMVCFTFCLDWLSPCIGNFFGFSPTSWSWIWSVS